MARLPILALLCLAACADGGKEETTQSAVKITETHHLFGFRTLPGFGTFPVKPEVVFTDRGTLRFFDDSKYTIELSEGTTSPEYYSLEETGELALGVTGYGREPSVLFRGGYSRTDSPAVPTVQFTDRVSTPNSQSVGLYLAAKLVPGVFEPADPTAPTVTAGNWHVASLHTIFGQTLPAPENVARAAYGGIAIAAGATGAERAINGSATQGTSDLGSSSITLGGTIQYLSPPADGTLNLTLSYGSDARVFDAAACGGDLILAVDRDETDGEAGIAVLLRKFDVPTTPIDPDDIDGTFLIGGHTLFVNPSNPGSDAFVGTVTLSALSGTTGAFRLDGVGNQGIDFSYSGTWKRPDSTPDDGSLEIRIPTTNETWRGYLSRDYRTLVIVDDYRESRSNNQPELNLVFGVREKT